MENKFLPTRKVIIGGKGKTRQVEIGGNAPISIQTMWKESIVDVKDDAKKMDAVLKKIDELQKLGCDILRFAVPDEKSAKSLVCIANNTSMPLVADIHFDYRLALDCLKGNVSAIRINPGNIGKRENVEKVVNACSENGVAIRIGVNSGSIPKDILGNYGRGLITRAEALSRAAAREVEIFNELNFQNIVVSMKASSVQETIDANEFFAKKYDIPLHIGVTEAGPLILGVVKSTLAFSHLLREGVGSTIRVSLSSSPENEVIAGKEILRECDLKTGGVTIVSCPRCGREGFDVHGFVEKWQNRLLTLDKNITVAIMGCVVNGPGEGKYADIGIAGSREKAIIFKRGEIVRTVDAKDAEDAFWEELSTVLP